MSPAAAAATKGAARSSRPGRAKRRPDSLDAPAGDASQPNRRRPRVLVIGGHEPTGRAGILADAWAVRSLGGEAVCVASAVTAQGVRTFASRPVAPALIGEQVRAAFELGPVDAVKVGLVATRASLWAIRSALRGFRGPVVVDPVVRTSKGERLSRLGRGDLLSWTRGAGRVLLTPNADEAAWLLGQRDGQRSPEWAEGAAKALVEVGFEAVVVKGGHLSGRPVEVLVERAVPGRSGRPMRSARVLGGARLERSPSVHRGTGCRFASALALGLASGASVENAVRQAQRLVRRFLSRGDRPPPRPRVVRARP